MQSCRGKLLHSTTHKKNQFYTVMYTSLHDEFIQKKKKLKANL